MRLQEDVFSPIIAAASKSSFIRLSEYYHFHYYYRFTLQFHFRFHLHFSISANHPGKMPMLNLHIPALFRAFYNYIKF